MSAAVYQRLYSTATFASSPVPPEANASSLAALSPVFALDLTAIDLPDGLYLKRVQMLQYDTRPMAQLAFVTASGNTVSLCIIARRNPDEPSEPGLTVGELLQLRTVDWRGDRNAYLLIGNEEPDAMTRYARRFAEQLL